ncbi:MAG: DUF885 domain-containing protein [Thermoanaerobaculia bacterium]
MKRLSLLICLLVVCGCKTTAPPTESQILKRIAGDYWHHHLDRDIALQIRHGLPIKHLPDASFANAQREATFAEAMLHRLDGVDIGHLEEEDRLTYSTLRWKNGEAADTRRYFWLLSPITPYASPIRGVNQAFTSGKIDPADRPNLLAEYARFIDQIAEVVREQGRRGYLLPKAEIAQVRSVITSYAQPPDRSLFRGGSDDPAVRDAITNTVNPALQRLNAVLSAEYEQGAPSAVGMSQYPGGAEAYQWLMRMRTSIDLTPESVHQLGLREVERIRRELEDVRRQAGFNGTLVEFRQFLKTDPRFFARSSEELGQRLTGYVRKIEPQIPKFFSKTPRAAYNVERLDPSLEGAMTFGYYQEPTAHDAVGHYYYNGSKVSDRNLLFAPALMLHELIPGHHFQIARQEENDALPAFRRESFDNAFVEGWGEYSAYLGSEMGIYDDPYERAGRLVMDSLLSVRLVVDTGMNALGWSRDRAMQYMRDNTFLSETEIATESLRYSVDIPAQALAYKIGSLKMIELRQKAQQQLGARFDIKRFHEWIIGSGSMPLSVLEGHVEREMRRQRDGS